MSSRKGTDAFNSGESQKQTAVAKTKQKRISNASDSPPGLINLGKKQTVKRTNLSQKTSKLEHKTVKAPKIAKKK